jgi:predicted RNase H-like HicB family nuclease
LTKYTILIQKAPEGGYGGQCLEIPAAISEGETVEELEANMKESIELVLESFYTV